MRNKSILILAVCLSVGLLNGCGAAEGSTAGQTTQNHTVGETSFADAADLVRDIPTVQKFTQEAVKDADIQLIVEAGVQSPSALNQQPWHFSVVTDQEVLQQISGDMGGGMPGAGDFPEGAGMPEGIEIPKGAEIPEGVEMPEGTERPSFDGNTPPEGMPEMPEGGERPSFEGGAPTGGAPIGGAGSMGNKAGIADAPLVIIVSAKAGSEFDAGLACQNMSVEAQLLGYGTKIISSPTMALNGEKQAEYKELLGIPEDQSVVAVLLIGFEDTTAAGENNVDAASTATTREATEDMVTYVKK